MRQIFIITKSELRGYLTSPAAYVFLVIFLLLAGFFTFIPGHFFAIGEASLQPFFIWHPWLYLFLVPAAGMHLWAEERRQGTLEWLFTMPATTTQCVIAKFIAVWIYLLVALLFTFPIVITVYYLGKPDTGALLCGYFGSALMAGCYLAITSFTSALTRSQVVSFIIAFTACLIINLAGWPPVMAMFTNWAPHWVINVVEYISVMPHFAAMQRGIIDSRDIIWFLSIIVGMLYLNIAVLEEKR